MPPKPKFDKSEVIAAALEIAKERGIEAVTAREVGARLGCSTRPVFTYFSGMEELQSAVRDSASERFFEYLKIADGYSPAFKMRGMQMIKFAQDEPKLFQFLFMTDNREEDFAEYIKTCIVGFEADADTIQDIYHIDRSAVETVFDQLWIYTYGMCVLCATGACMFTQQETASLLGKAFLGTLLLVKSGYSDKSDVIPVQNGSNDSIMLGGAAF